jgi:hypothetical protein
MMEVHGWLKGHERTVADSIAAALNEITRVAPHKQQSKRAAAISEFGTTLRRLVDQWIDSGNGGDGCVNLPAEMLKEIGESPRVLWRSPKYPEPILKTLTDFWERNRPTVVVGIDGRSTPTPRSVSLNPKHLVSEARDGAIYRFQQLLDSPGRDLLSRCDGCKAYFVRARAPKKNMPIKHGTFCKGCKGRGSAKRTSATRDERKQKMVELAADWWPNWPQKKRSGKRSEWVAEMVNKKPVIPGVFITGKWVTQNQRAIEMEVERRENAKG